MVKKIIYAIGGLFVFLYILGMILPTVGPIQKPQNNTIPVSDKKITAEDKVEDKVEKDKIPKQVEVQKEKPKVNLVPTPVPVKTEPVAVIEKVPEDTEKAESSPVLPTEKPSSRFYTSSHYTAKYYYPSNCDEWNALSKSYLKSFDSLDALLAKHPSRTLSPQCH